MAERRPVVAVVGSALADPTVLAAAEALGRGLVDAGWRVATGGKGGVMEAASRGARQAPGWFDGAVIGVLPGADTSEANAFVEIVLPTGMGYARNVLLVGMADLVIAIAGGSGTLSEVAMAWQLGKPLIALDQGVGWSAQLADLRLDGRRADRVHRAEGVEAALDLAARLLRGG
ncbi:MAG: TIGR00725 family protein [Alphaproteobacteria bacterium]|nr:TIGR00725 family protein [Alphaproteobacteria bacterium]